MKTTLKPAVHYFQIVQTLFKDTSLSDAQNAINLINIGNAMQTHGLSFLTSSR